VNEAAKPQLHFYSPHLLNCKFSEVGEGGVFLRSTGKAKLTLAQKLKAFDPLIHK
jgi:hypothetical protein